MIKEKKFRAWDEEKKYMAYQGEPDLETIQSFIFHFGDKLLLEYVGISDRDGELLFEGDFLFDRHYNYDNECFIDAYYPICWCNLSLSWCVDVSFNLDESCLYPITDYFNSDTLQKKGNRFENPELLKK